MARPQKDGIDYFPFDVYFFEDTKIEAIRGEFGGKGELLALRLLCLIYRDHGYWALWDGLNRGIICNRVGVTPALADDIVRRLVEWGFFDKEMFDSFSVLTSNGIQTRYFEAVYQRKHVSKKDLPYLLTDKCPEKGTSKVVNCTINTPTGELIAQKTPQSKVNQSKPKENVVTTATADFCENDFAGFDSKGNLLPENHYGIVWEKLCSLKANGIEVKAAGGGAVLPTETAKAYNDRLRDFGLDGILAAIEKLRESAYWKKEGSIGFSHFLKEQTITRLLEDGYKTDFSQKPGGYGKPQSGKPNSRRSRADYTEAELAAMTAEEKVDNGIATENEKDEYNRQQEEKYKLWKSTLPPKGTEK